jgi:RimJ/RimL family protein N-acetyltransferase
MLTLHAFTPDDFDELCRWFDSESALVQWGGVLVRFPLDHAQLEDMLALGQATPPSRQCWMVERAGAVIGHIQLAFDRHHGNATISRVALAPQVRGEGLAAPMLRRILAEAFSHPAIERAQLNVFTFNTPAIRTYERAGFRTEGIHRAAVRVGAARWDTMAMGLLRHEWSAGRDGQAAL